MAIKDSRRLSIVVPYLYPDLDYKDGKDYYLQNDSDGKGTYVIWNNKDITKPTDQELADAKEDAINDDWWKVLRYERDQLLKESDEYAVSDRPDNADWISYREKLRNLPTTVTKPDYEVLNNQEKADWLTDLLPTVPK